MKRLLLPLLAALALPITGNTKLFAKPPESCRQFGQFWVCFNSDRGKDMLNTPKIIGWTYIEFPAINSTMYVDRTGYKLNHNGEYGRFIHRRVVSRIYRDAETGRLPTTTTIGKARANCYGSDYSIDCIITPAPTITIPGKAPKPARIQQDFWDYIFDCEDGSYTRHLNKGKGEKWKSFSSKPWFIATPGVKRQCSNIASLEVSSFSKYVRKGIKKRF